MADDTLKTDELPPEQDPNKIQIDVDKLKQTKVHICMHCSGGMLTE